MTNISQIENKLFVNRTMLCLGPMSLNSIHAIKNVYQNCILPLSLIASRNQIESTEFGGGYVNNWTTKTFQTDCSNIMPNISIGRDHGGPYQGSYDQQNAISDSDALKYALKSLENDILNDFTYIHLDPSKYTKGDITVDGMLNSLKEMYAHCCEFSIKNDKSIFFEIGGEGHGPEVDSVEELEYFLSNFQQFVSKNKLKKPTFCVAKLGSYVREDKNVGSFKELIRNNTTEKIESIVSIIHKYNLKVKMHNADYFSPEIYSSLPTLKIDAINLAPQLGVMESRFIVNELKQNSMKQELDQFYDIAYNSGMWKKWTDQQKPDIEFSTLLAGHYIFSTKDFMHLRERILLKIPNLDEKIILHLTEFVKATLIQLNNWKP